MYSGGVFPHAGGRAFYDITPTFHMRYFLFPRLSSMCQLEPAPVAGRFAEVSQEPNVGLVNPFFQLKRTGYNNPFLGKTGY